MPNPYFRFKKFTIQQDRCAMKVCTDACILGAWSSERLNGVKKILDIGTGTGLLSLMMAQKSDAMIDAIEWDPESCKQAMDNIQNSPWQDRIRLLEGDARSYRYPGTYDYIICNPPFFESGLRSPDPKKNNAKHDESMKLDELIDLIKLNLSLHGVFSILLPFYRTEYFEDLAALNGFYLLEKLIVRQTPVHPPFRSICLFGFEGNVQVHRSELTIKNQEGKYTEEFGRLLGDYYG
jgi:tRNA1Val (adenine37-N6)-methyltransferase